LSGGSTGADYVEKGEKQVENFEKFLEMFPRNQVLLISQIPFSTVGCE
jgi:hypothetical protein